MLRLASRPVVAGAAYSTAAATPAPLSAATINIRKTLTPRPKPKLEGLAFGASFTDHLLEVDWTREGGWGTPSIRPFDEKLTIHPAASALHYGLECFEGMKAYLDKNGDVRLFRPDMNMRRFKTSSIRLGLPSFDETAAGNLIRALVKHEKDWIPNRDQYSLYIRPTMIATQETLGVSAANKAKFYVILSPVGPYYPTGFAPVKLIADPINVRAFHGGVGWAKVGGNYAPTIQPLIEAQKKGFQQVLWLLNGQVTEVGTMNMFTFWINKNGEKELITPPLDGTILPGVTRDSILALARGWGEFKVSEAPYTISDVVAAVNEKRMIECFGAGTAAIVSPVSLIHYNGSDLPIPLDPSNTKAGAGPLTMRFFKTIIDIQYGHVDHPWSVKI